MNCQKTNISFFDICHEQYTTNNKNTLTSFEKMEDNNLLISSEIAQNDLKSIEEITLPDLLSIVNNIFIMKRSRSPNSAESIGEDDIIDLPSKIKQIISENNTISLTPKKFSKYEYPLDNGQETHFLNTDIIHGRVRNYFAVVQINDANATHVPPFLRANIDSFAFSGDFSAWTVSDNLLPRINSKFGGFTEFCDFVNGLDENTCLINLKNGSFYLLKL